MRVEPDTRDPVARAEALVRLFCSPGNFGAIRSVAPSQVPEPARTLLDHHSHMTVAMERFHGGDVRLRVVASVNDGSGKPTHPAWYAREILLETQGGKIVQHGIVRIDLSLLDAATVAAILAAKIPLGRILIEANLLRDVHDVGLLEVVPGPHLRRLFGPAAAATPRTFGRVAEISLGGRPAIELLEIAAPGLLPKTLR